MFRLKKIKERDKIPKGFLEVVSRDSLYNKIDKDFSFGEVLNKFYAFQVSKNAFTYNRGTKEEFTMPQEALVCYVQPNPSNEIKVAVKRATSIMESLSNYAISKESEILRSIVKSNRNGFASERAKFIEREWVNFDLDLLANFLGKKGEIKKEVLSIIQNCKVVKKGSSILVVDTYGGWHFLIHNDSLCENPNYILNEVYKTGHFKEVEYHSEGFLVPMPGTLQYGVHKVTFSIERC